MTVLLNSALYHDDASTVLLRGTMVARMPRAVVCPRTTPMRERLLGDPRMRNRRKLRDTKAFFPLTKSLLKPKLRTGGGKRWWLLQKNCEEGGSQPQSTWMSSTVYEGVIGPTY